MTLLSRRTLVGVVLLVGLICYFTEIGEELRFCSRNDRQLSYSGDIKAFFCELVVGGDYTRLLHRSFGQSRVETRREVEKIFVDKSGLGDTRTVQEAVDAVRDGNKKRVTIYIAAGTYM